MFLKFTNEVSRVFFRAVVNVVKFFKTISFKKLQYINNIKPEKKTPFKITRLSDVFRASRGRGGSRF